MSTFASRWLFKVSSLMITLVCCAGCHRDMQDQPRYETLEASNFFADGKSSRPLVEGTVARGSLSEAEIVKSGRSKGELVESIPLEVDRALLLRGQERFNIYCAVCHGRTGQADGMVVQRGFRQPPSYHTERLRNLPDGHYFDVISNGFGVMPAFRLQTSPRDRWAIVAYVRVLQLSQQASLGDVPAEDRRQLEGAQP
jgi:mono/diheme cytochrome c family protein